MTEQQTSAPVSNTRPNAWLLAGVASVAAAGVWAYARRSGRADDQASRDRLTYPPLDEPKAIDDGLWIVDSGPISAMGLGLPIRMTIVRLTNGDLLLHSATPYSAELAYAIDALGRVRHLVAPNVAHWTFLAEWQRAYPDAVTWASPGLGERPQVRASDVRIDTVLKDTAPEEWADVLDQGVVIGKGGFTETWFFHRPTRTLLLVDLIENLEPDKLPPVERWLMQAAAATRGTTARYLRIPVHLGGEQARRSIRAMLALDPNRVIFAHGRIFDRDAAACIHRAFDWLVRMV